MDRPVFLEGDLVELRPLDTDDATFLQTLINDPRVRLRLGAYEPFTHTQEVEWIEQRDESDEVNLIITADDDRVGIIGFTPKHQAWGIVEAGYFVHPDHWGYGYATDALECICRYAFTERRLHKVAAEVFETNEASQRVLEKVGFVEEGRFQAEAFIDGEYVDVLRYGLLGDDFDD